MFLTGSYPRSLDDKYRFTLPKTLRDTLEEAGGLVLYIAPGTDRSLVIYTASAFQRLGDQVGQGPPTAEEVRTFSRLFYAQAQRVELDRQGRVRIPTDLASLALAGRDIVLLGVRDHLEVWDRDRWQTYLGEKQPLYDEIAERAFGRGVQAPAPGGAGQSRQLG